MKEIEIEIEDKEIEIGIIDEEEILKNKYEKGQLRIVRTSMDFQLTHLNQMLKDEMYLNINPSYQRRTRWDKKKNLY